MNRRFVALLAGLEAKYQELLAMTPVAAAQVRSDSPKGGVYLFSEGRVHLYVGRTKRHIHVRIRDHFGANRDAASFPWLIAREKTGMSATYRQSGSRRELLADREFGKAYADAKTRIREMDVRYVGESEPLRQTLLEIYVAVAADAKYNDFSPH